MIARVPTPQSDSRSRRDPCRRVSSSVVADRLHEPGVRRWSGAQLLRVECLPQGPTRKPGGSRTAVLAIPSVGAYLIRAKITVKGTRRASRVTRGARP
jgi:hypothetical protein